MIARAHRALLALVLPLAVIGCGADDNEPGGLDRNDPEAVARAYIATYYDCGDRGAGLRWDLTARSRSENETSREDALASERDDGCRPTRVPEIRTARGATRGDFTEVIVRNPDACPSTDELVLVLVRGDSGYAVDSPSVTDDTDCVRNGSTS